MISCLCFLGNQLGDAVDELIEKMDSFGKKDRLASFDDNEEPDSEEEDEGEDDEEEEEEEGEGDREEDESADNLALEIKGIGLSPNSRQLRDDSELTVSLRKSSVSCIWPRYHYHLKPHYQNNYVSCASCLHN